MAEANDIDLLREYSNRGSEAAFGELVRRHVSLVYCVALRITGNSADAQDVAQAVFIILARKASGLSARVVLTGWLYETTRFIASRLLRARARRLAREQESSMQLNVEGSPTGEVWRQIAPHLEAAMSRLGERDRTLLALRYYENKTGAEAAALLGIHEEAARKRTNRALKKLRRSFWAHGVTSSTAALAEAISTHALQTAPPALAVGVTAVALAKGATASTSTLTLIKGALKIMAWTKAKIAACAAVGLVMAAGVSVVVVHRESLIQGRTEAEWINSIEYRGGDSQTKLWHSLGPKGIRMLVRAMKPPPPGLPEERAIAHRKTRMCAADVLVELANNYEEKSAAPEVIKLLKSEKDGSVRALELSYFGRPFQTMTDAEKTALLPELLRSAQGKNSGERNNALVALQYYTNQSEVVLPVLAHALEDPIPGVRVMAAKALNQFDPDLPANSNLVSVLARCVTDPQGDMPGAANDAVITLGKLHRDPDVAVPALIQALRSDSSYLRNNAAAALGQFGGKARSAIPSLQSALQDADPRVRRQAATAINQINSDLPRN